MKNVYLIGATGSIGDKVLEVIRNNKDEYNLISVGAGNNISKLEKIIEEFNPSYVSVKDYNKDLIVKYPNVKFYFGNNGLIDLLKDKKDNALFFNAIVGSIGLLPTVYAVKNGFDIALANKESIVLGGSYLINLVKEHGVNLIPVDSEHSSIFMLLDDNIEEVIITASGGALRDFDSNEEVSIKDVLKHPNWKMGNKITVDSSTMVNKALEVIEAHYLFNLDYNKIKAVINYESIVHALVKYSDGSYKALMNYPDMIIPVSYGLSYPKRYNYNFNLDFSKLKLNFKEIDKEKYKTFYLILDYAKINEAYPIISNASNEEAVYLFLNGLIKYNNIYDIIKDCLEYFSIDNNNLNLEKRLDLDIKVRNYIKRKYGAL